MQYIDAKFKDRDPRETVEKIQTILDSLGIQVQEKWHESGVEGCHSVTLRAVKGMPSYNGKGVTKEFARASAYAEFIERIQAGIYPISYQSIQRDKELNLHTYAPDKRYMTVEELVEEGEWMDPIISSYSEAKLTRQSLAQQCKAYACADDGQILTVPFYSLFENKYVYLPIDFVGRMYTANGNCAGNTREEAWVHALSEMMERSASQKYLMKGEAAPRIPEETLRKFPVVSKILDQVKAEGQFDITVFDYSIGNNFPVVSTRIIDKKNQNYHVNVAADPVLEIAVQRTLTELLQGRGLHNLRPRHSGKILKHITDFPVAHNVQNQLHNSSGLHTADYFADELTCTRLLAQFPDNSKKTNKELLNYMLDLYRALGKPVYVRNYSYLGFHSYKFVVPGFSEAKGVYLGDKIPEYAMGDSAREAYKNAPAATNADLAWMMRYDNSTKTLYGRHDSFSVNAGVPIGGRANIELCFITRAYASYRLGKYADAIGHMLPMIRNADTDEWMKDYFACVNKYLEMKADGIDEEKIKVILYKFCMAPCVDALYEKLDQGKTPYEDYLMRCDLHSCANCRYESVCCYYEMKALTEKVGKVYQTFVNGQDPSEFAVD
ncbi:MAG: hypothetical protein E7439_02350 [Ruminococcaceae bacterium]|nr:hypothetical protein [Oscillospiraceae bacterium]